MKNTVRIISLVIVLSLCLSTVCFASAQASGSSLEGSWKLTSVKSDCADPVGLILAMALINTFGEISFSFSNGRVLAYISLFGQSEMQYGSYQVIGNWVVLTLSDTEWMQYDVIGSTLILSDSNGNSLVFTRK